MESQSLDAFDIGGTECKVKWFRRWSKVKHGGLGLRQLGSEGSTEVHSGAMKFEETDIEYDTASPWLLKHNSGSFLHRQKLNSDHCRSYKMCFLRQN
ncbi:hypothetical protein AAHA92_08178 [Salvia divinorum]|uniref:Uncharacterized protein n=1 Tax=Salvia divinorum TaxID=28513 RepID=A0ABD1HMD7_SALDI